MALIIDKVQLSESTTSYQVAIADEELQAAIQEQQREAPAQSKEAAPSK